MDQREMKYAELVIKRQLQLRRGEALSINTESSTIEFARLLGKLAAEVTIQAVQIVETEKGRIKQVYPIEPKENEALRPKTTGLVMCHIVDLDDCPYYSEESPVDIAKDVVQLGKFGLLAEPVELDRRLAYPWANIPYPGANWGLQYLGETATEDDLWNLFTALYRLDTKDPDRFWEDQGLMLAYRKKRLNAIKPEKLEVVGDGWSFTCALAKATEWTGGEQRTSSNRTFYSILPVQHLYATIDGTSANGTLASTRPFLLLGKQVVGASFTLKDGKAIAWSAEKGAEALDAFFTIDDGARVLSELSLADEDTLESRHLSRGVHPLFNKAMTTHVGFGGFALDTLSRHITEEELSSLHLNQSLVRMDVPMGSRSLSVTAVDPDGTRHILVDEGVFSEEEAT
jgi:aminopeptidase